eukprot:XP_016658382.1 PREDICTED: nucleic-acid-binding protein from mobile element jockey-like [Acyrthosiphon pisum]
MSTTTNKNNNADMPPTNKPAKTKLNVNTNIKDSNHKASSSNVTQSSGWSTQNKGFTPIPLILIRIYQPLHIHALLNLKKKIFITNNRYEVLSSLEQSADHPVEASQDTNFEPDAPSSIKPPPPIFLKHVEDFPGLCTVLCELIGVDNFQCKSTPDQLKIQTTIPEAYRTLVRYLRDEKAQFHTFQLKEDKPTRVVIRNLHPTTPTSLIKNLEPTTHSNEIFELNSLLHTKVKVEEPHKSKTIAQCTNCQDYGHTKAYCGHPPRCVRCGKDHHSSSCPKSRDEPPCCALSHGNHPASYKGCSTYKELQYCKKSNSNNNKFLFDTKDTNFKSNFVQDNHPVGPTPTISPKGQNQSYAEAVANQTARHELPPSTPKIPLLLQNPTSHS